MASTSTDIIDGVSSSLAVKAPVFVATTANITLSGLQTIDGVAGAENTRVLVKNQTDSTQNGIYDMKSGAWLRSADFNGARDVTRGTIVNVVAGTVNAGYFFSVTTSDPVIGVTAIEWVDVALNVNDTVADLIADATAAQAAAEAAQAAAEAAQASAEAAATSSDYLSTGLGATAGITVLGSLDATNTASGYTRYDNTTAGTFPSGVTKADGGIVATYRRTVSSFVQTLYAITTTRTYERRYEGSFGSWEEVIKTPLGAATNNSLIYNGSAWVAGTPGWVELAYAGSMNATSIDFTASALPYRELELRMTAGINSTNSFLVQLSGNAGVISTGYVSSSTSISTATAASTSDTTGFVHLHGVSGNAAFHGKFRFTKNTESSGAGVWLCEGISRRTIAGDGMAWSYGRVTVPGDIITAVRLTRLTSGTITGTAALWARY